MQEIAPAALAAHLERSAEEIMPTRLKILVLVFIAFALTNAGNALLIVYRHVYIAWLARSALSVAVSCTYLVCAYAIWQKRTEARWLTTTFVAVMMAMIFGPDIYRFGLIVSQRSEGSIFAPDMQIPWVRAVVYLLFVLIIPFLVYRLISSEKSKSWLTS